MKKSKDDNLDEMLDRILDKLDQAFEIQEKSRKTLERIIEITTNTQTVSED